MGLNGEMEAQKKQQWFHGLHETPQLPEGFDKLSDCPGPEQQLLAA
jgi:hypothetical protein